MTLLALLIVLGVLVFVHELGHFLAAKWAGIYVHRFSLGLGAPIKALTTKRGETEYAISWLPLGGYVKMASAEEDATSAALEGGHEAVPVPADRVFESKPVWKRMIVILAGVTMNLLFAWAVNVGLAAKNGRAYDPTTTVGRVIPELVPRGAEAVLQIPAGTRITAVQGQPVESWDDIVFGIVQAAGRDVRLRLGDGRELVLPVHADALEARSALAQALQPARPPVVGQAVPGLPAAKAGLESGDTLVTVDGQPVRAWHDLVGRIEQSGGRPVRLDVSRHGAARSFTVTPFADTTTTLDQRKHVAWKLGIAPVVVTKTERYDALGAVKAGTVATGEGVVTLVRTVRGLFTGRVSGKSLGGPILIAQQAGAAAELGVDTFLAFMAFVSINLAVLNLLPVPVLDGGQFVFLLAEAVLRRPLPLKVRERLTSVGLLLILALMVFAFWNDFTRLFRGWGWIH
jgi:regulator of sigma E protease